MNESYALVDYFKEKDMFHLIFKMYKLSLMYYMLLSKNEIYVFVFVSINTKLYCIVSQPPTNRISHKVHLFSAKWSKFELINE